MEHQRLVTQLGFPLVLPLCATEALRFLACCRCFGILGVQAPLGFEWLIHHHLVGAWSWAGMATCARTIQASHRPC